MATMYCALCGRPVEAKRQIGAGTIILAVLTGGVWLAAIPFYRKRCSICKSAAVSLTAPAAAAGRISAVEQRLTRTENELEAATTELERLREERDFYRDLVGDRALRERNRPGD
ncbi:MAG TPA: hypothetical protein VFZ24_17885 [Longimicrobiales bacterium]